MGLVIGGLLAPIDWLGNVTFAIGLIALMVGVSYGIQPYGDQTMSWGSPKVLAELGGGVLFLVLFCFIETRVEEPMFHLDLFRIRAFSAGNLASLLSSIGRGGLQFVLIIWLQGIWLPQHGYGFSEAPLYAGLYMVPLTLGFLIAGPVSGILPDRYGARPFATGGMLVAAVSFLLLEQLPVDFAYPAFGALLLLNGIGMGLFASPNRAGIMNSLPPRQRGVGGGMSHLPELGDGALDRDLLLAADRRPRLQPSRLAGKRAAIARCLPRAGGRGRPPAAGGEPLRRLPRLQPGRKPARPGGAAPIVRPPGGDADRPLLLPAADERPLEDALGTAFTFSFVACLVAAAASWLRGGKYHRREESEQAGPSSQPARRPEGVPT